MALLRLGAVDVAVYLACGSEDSCRGLLEALRLGKPVIASRSGAIPELLPDSCGRLVAAGDAAELAQAMRELAEDAELRQRLEAASRLRGEEFGWARYVEELRQIYQVLVG